MNNEARILRHYSWEVQGTTWYQVSDEEGNPVVDSDGQAIKFQGKAKFLEYMKENEEFTQSLMKRILEGA